MDITFISQRLRTACEHRRSAEKQFGAEVATALFAVLSDVRALPHGRALVDLHGEGTCQIDGQLSIELALGRVLVMRAAHAETPLTEEGHVDWQSVSRIQVIEVKVL